MRAPWTSAFENQLRQLGWIEGQNVNILYRWADGQTPRMSDQEQRERESQESDGTKYEEERDKEHEERDRIAEEIREEPPLTERD